MARYEIVAPIGGIFYAARHPSEPPLVALGDSVEIGQTVAILEVMKTFCDIDVEEVAGVVEELPVENGTLVEQGAVLVVLRA